MDTSETRYNPEPDERALDMLIRLDLEKKGLLPPTSFFKAKFRDYRLRLLSDPPGIWTDHLFNCLSVSGVFPDSNSVFMTHWPSQHTPDHLQSIRTLVSANNSQMERGNIFVFSHKQNTEQSSAHDQYNQYVTTLIQQVTDIFPSSQIKHLLYGESIGPASRPSGIAVVNVNKGIAYTDIERYEFGKETRERIAI